MLTLDGVIDWRKEKYVLENKNNNIVGSGYRHFNNVFLLDCFTTVTYKLYLTNQ